MFHINGEQKRVDPQRILNTGMRALLIKERAENVSNMPKQLGPI